MTPPRDYNQVTTTTLCVVCQKASVKADEKACSQSCLQQLIEGEKQLQAARNMSREIKDLYYSYQLGEQTKRRQEFY